MMKSRRRRMLIVFVALSLAMVTLGAIPDRLILFPTTQRINAGAAQRKSIPFQHGELEIWTARSQLAQRAGAPDSYILRFYGNADRAERWVAAEAEEWDRRAVEVWGMNFPGFGKASLICLLPNDGASFRCE